MMTHRSIDRRTFLKGTAAGAAVSAFGFPNILRAAGATNKLNIAVVGTMNQAWWNISQIQGENIVALCDVDANGLDRAKSGFPDARTYADYRIMLEKQKDIDAVLIATPDHHHASAALRAMQHGYHVYCEKPLAHSVYETRALQRTAVEKQLATQMGTQIHAGDNYRRVVELIRAGTIGDVRQVHVWCGKSWSNGRFGESKEPPAHLDWDLWLGPAKERPYCDGVHPGNWRRFWEFGTGTLGDMACHYVDLVHWALDLTLPTSIHTEGPDEVHPDGTPAWLIVHYEHPARGNMPPIKMTWYDGGKRPEVLQDLKQPDGSQVQWGDGHLFIGSTGMIISDYGRHLVLRDRVVTDEFDRPDQIIPRSIGHHQEWIAACKTGSPTTCHFGYSGPLTEAVLLGNVSYRAKTPLSWNAEEMRSSESTEEVAALVKPDMREGWRV